MAGGGQRIRFCSRRRPFRATWKPDTRAIAGGALGLLGLAVSLSQLPVFKHGVVLSVLPSGLARALIALTIAAGAAATVMGLVIFTAAMEAPTRNTRSLRFL